MAKLRFIALVLVVVFFVPSALYAQSPSFSEDGQPPTLISGSYFTTYYAEFDDWQVFPVLIPMISRNGRLQYDERFDLTPDGQIRGRLEGSVAQGQYTITLPDVPRGSAWFDTDGDPQTPSSVKVFVAGTASGMIATDHVGLYDFIYTRSFAYDPNTHLWGGLLVVWAEVAEAHFPILSGADSLFYTADDVQVTVPKGWSLVEIKAKPAVGTQSVRVFRTSRPVIDLREAPQFQAVDLRSLSYQESFARLLDELERTYIFTDYRGVDWEALREKYLPKAAQVRDVREFHQLLENALFSFRDGHLAILGPGLPDWLWGKIGMQVYPVNGELMVIDTDTGSPVGRSAIIPGSVITHVNGQDAMRYFESVPRAIYSAGHESEDMWFRGDLAFRAEPGAPFEIAYRLPNGQTGEVVLRSEPITEITDDYTPSPPGPLYYTILESGIGIITIRNFTSAFLNDRWDDAIQAMQAENVFGIIIDLRSNGGGFSGIANYMVGDFLDEDMYAGREVSSLDEDGDGVTDIQEEFYYGRGRKFDPTRVVVLVGPNCFSACEFAAQAFQDVGAQVIGHLTSGGAGGGVGASYYLPDDTQVYGMAVVRSENAQGEIMVEGKGVRLDVQVPFTPEGLASGRDLVLEAAEQLLMGGQAVE